MGRRPAVLTPYLVTVIDMNTGVTGPPEAWDPGFPRRPTSLVPALVALVLMVVSSAAVVTGLYRALEVRYTPPANFCAGLDAGSIATLTKSPPPVTVPDPKKPSCGFAVGRSAAGTLSAEYAASAFEVRVLHAMDNDPQTEDGERQELPGVGQGAWVVGEGVVISRTCQYSAQAHDVNLVVHLRLELLSAFCEPVAARSAISATLRGSLARLS